MTPCCPSSERACMRSSTFLLKRFLLKHISAKFNENCLQISMKLYHSCSKNGIPCIFLIAMATERFNKSLKIFLSKTKRPSALIFGMLHYPVVLYEDCSNYAQGPKWGQRVFFRKNLFLTKTHSLEIYYLVCNILRSPSNLLDQVT